MLCALVLSGPTAQAGDGDLQAAAQNPVANLISLPFQNNLLFGVGPNDEIVNVLNIQPVIPFALSDEWNVITRTIAPLIYVPSTVAGLDVLPMGVGTGTEFGLGDINFTAFVSPASPGAVVWGVGPSVNLPTATDSLLGSEKVSIGPSVVVLAQPQPWTVGALARQLWSVAGDDDRADVNQFLIQPFVNYNLADGWYLVSAPVLTANWDAPSGQRWTVPVGGGVGRLFRVGKLPVNASLQTYYNIERPTLGPEWAIRFQVQFLFPR
jgi:hypothetical protein